MKKGISLIIICLVLINTNGQDNKSVQNKVYRLNYKIEVPITFGLFALNYYGYNRLRQKSTLDAYQITSLDKNDIWSFDRRAVLQSSSQRLHAQNLSDWGMNISLFMPILLFLDKEIRQSWFDITLLYFETQAINYNLYAWAGPMLMSRKRPIVYYDEIPLNEKIERGTTNSFFSGHTSTTAAASFFMAKVLSDYHPEWGSKRWVLFAAALIPPAFVGYHRYRGLKHFPTDIAIGTAIGATVGILTPQLHKINKKNGKSYSMAPFSGEYTGLAFMMKF